VDTDVDTDAADAEGTLFTGAGGEDVVPPVVVGLWVNAVCGAWVCVAVRVAGFWGVEWLAPLGFLVSFLVVWAPPELALPVAETCEPPVALPAVPVELPPAVEESASPVAHATPGVLATATPTPNATANAPTRPTCFAYPMRCPPPAKW
jgi:hypothetical protein